MQANTPLNGLSHATANTTTPDGDCFSLVNLRKKDNSLQPVTSGTPIATLTDNYDIVYIHTNNFTQNWIAGKGGILYTDIKTVPIKVCELETPIRHIQGIGNTLSLFTDTGIFYLLFKDNAYHPLGYKPPLPPCKIQCQTGIYITPFSTIEGTITDVQKAMEAMIIKNRWKEDNAYMLCGSYALRYALRLFDNSYILHSNPIFILPDVNNHPYYVTLAFNGTTLLPANSYAKSKLYTLKLNIDLSSLKAWSDIIAGIDIFISPELGLISEDFGDIKDCTIYTIPPNNLQPYTSKLIRPLKMDKQKIIAGIEQIENFYLIRSIPVNTSDTSFSFPEKSYLSDMRNLIHQPTLGMDNFSHHHITASATYTYNQRLHMGNLLTYFSQGFDFRAFTPNLPDIIIHDDTTDSSTSRPGSGNQSGDTALYNAARIYIEVWLNTGNEDTYVLSKSDNTSYNLINAFFSYPDTRAYKAVINICDTQNNIKETITLDLKPHPNLNIAYYIDTSLLKINLKTIGNNPPLRYFERPTNNIKIIEANKLKVSALQNPFVFPNENTYITGNCRIIGMGANTAPVSEGQFGQFPLYVFTDEGIYILAVGSGNTVYSNVAPVSEEIALPGTIQSVTGAVFFLSVRGAYIISGSKPTPLSTSINTYNATQRMQHYDEIVQSTLPELANLRIRPFLDFIRSSGISLHFNYPENEIIISDTTASYAYVYNFNSQSWHTVTHTFTPVLNCFPQLYGISNGVILDITRETATPAPVILLTRPFKFGSQQFKRLDRHILRAYLNNPGILGLFTFSSNDAINFRLKTNKRIAAGQHRDTDTGLIALNKYRYFALMLTGYLDKESRIDFVTSTVYPVYNNDKNR